MNLKCIISAAVAIIVALFAFVISIHFKDDSLLIPSMVTIALLIVVLYQAIIKNKSMNFVLLVALNIVLIACIYTAIETNGNHHNSLMGSSIYAAIGSLLLISMLTYTEMQIITPLFIFFSLMFSFGIATLSAAVIPYFEPDELANGMITNSNVVWGFIYSAVDSIILSILIWISTKRKKKWFITGDEFKGAE